MKTSIKKITFLSFIYFALFFLSNEAFRLNKASIYNFDFNYYMRVIFLFVDNSISEFHTINEFTITVYFSILLFCLWFLLLNCYGFSRAYRGLIIQRHHTKSKFILLYQFRVFVISIFLVLFIWIVSVFLFYYQGASVNLSNKELIDSIIFILNLMVYFNICTIVNIYLDIKFKETISIIITLFFTAVILITDLYISRISIITLGETTNMLIGFALQIIILTFSNCIIHSRVKTIDIL